MKNQISYVLTGITIATLAACGGGGGTTSSSTPSLTGTVAVGAPLAEAQVTLKDVNGKTSKPVSTDANGSYTISDLTGFVKPVMLEATGTVNGKAIALHSVLETVPTGSTSGVLNATPATEAVTAHALGADPATAFQKATPITNDDLVNLKKAKDNLAAVLGTSDLFTTAFKADGTGIDQLLDLASFEGSSSEILVVNKTTKAPVSVSKDQQAPTTPTFTLSEAEKKLDTSGIKTLMTSLNATLGSASSIRSGMNSLISDSYLQEGKNKAAITDMFASALVGATYTGYTIDGCSAAINGLSAASSSQTCNVNFSIKLQDKSTVVDGTSVVYDSIAKKWSLYGDRSPFQFDLKPVANAEFSVSAIGTIATPSVRTGMNLWIPTADNTYASAKLKYSVDGGSTYNQTPLQEFGKFNVCSSGFLTALPLTAGTANCTNFFEISDDLANTLNEAAKKGKYKLKIDLYTSTDRSGDPAASFELAGKPQYTSTTGGDAVKNSGMNISGKSLGTNSVSFTGSNVDYLDISSSYAANTATGTGTATISWEDSSLTKLANVVTITNANAQCKANGDSNCDTKFSSTSVIHRIMLVKRDALGRAVWANYYK